MTDIDKYGSIYREKRMEIMSQPAGFHPMNRRTRRHFDNLRLFLWLFAGVLMGATAILVYDRLVQGLR